jgi:3-oxoadipate enol-lactonase
MYIQGSGPPLLVIPGIQGRWEWMRPALNALARHARVISYSLCGDLGSGLKMDPALGFDAFIRQVDQVLDRIKVDRLAVCGVSFGGIVAAKYAALRPERVTHLVLASAPGPSWKPSARQARYVSRPWISLPAFCLTAVNRLGAEIHDALPDWPSRIGFTLGYGVSALKAPMLPGLMARRVRLQQTVDLRPDCARVTAPTLVITGDPRLDRVVPVESTKEYLTAIPGARYEMMDHTGHLGLLTQPDRFARIVGAFVQRAQG